MNDRPKAQEAPYELPAVVCLLTILVVGSMLAMLRNDVGDTVITGGIGLIGLLLGILGTLHALSSPKRQP